MTLLLDTIDDRARRRGEAVALEGEAEGEVFYLSYAGLRRAVAETAARLAGRGVVALLLDNGPAWVVVDLAALAAGVTLLPLPPFFSPEQVAHALAASGAGTVVTDAPERFPGFTAEPAALTVAGVPSAPSTLLTRPAAPPAELAGCAKITFTSGTTGRPKGVKLSVAAQEQVARSLAAAAAGREEDRHLCLLPLATLLENIGGVYAPLLAGARVIVPPLARCDLRGAAGLDAAALAAALHRHAATSAILVPAMLQGLVMALEAGAPRPPALRYLAVGGAPVAPGLLTRAAALGLPLHQGYGLSECASVVAVNRPGAERPGSVGRPLPHARLRFAPDGEILVAGALFDGYLGAEEGGAAADGWWPTGDLGHLDGDGYLWLTGRKKNLFITAFGRNVAPEWIECRLAEQPAIAQAVVFGEARPWNTAVVVSAADPQSIETALEAANRELPDYARVTRWLRADEPFTPANGQLTANGRPRREAIHARYAERIDACYP